MVNCQPPKGPAGPAHGRRTTGPGASAIVIPAFNGLEYLRKCVASIVECTTVPFGIIVVNNGSTDGTAEWLDEERIEHIDNPRNRGFPAAVNQGIRLACENPCSGGEGGDLVVMNSDVVVTPHWLRRLREHFRGDPSAGIVGPCTNYVSGVQLVKGDYGTDAGRLRAFAEQRYRRFQAQAQEVDRVVGFCMVVRRQCIEDVGLFDERFGIGNFEDDDLCRRARMSGWRVLWAQDVFVHHFGSRSFALAGMDYRDLIRRNARLYFQKWHVNPGEQKKHPAAAAFSGDGGSCRREETPVPDQGDRGEDAPSAAARFAGRFPGSKRRKVQHAADAVMQQDAPVTDWGRILLMLRELMRAAPTGER